MPARYKTWLGQVSNADPHDLPPGAGQEQVNMQCIVAGEIRCRQGMVRSTMTQNDGTAEGGTSAATDIISMFATPWHAEVLVYYQTSDGEVYLGRNPT